MYLLKKMLNKVNRVIVMGWLLIFFPSQIYGEGDPGTTTELDKVYLDLTVPLDSIVDEGNSSYVQFVKDVLGRSPLVYYSTDLLVNQMWKLTYTTALLATSREDRRLLISFPYKNDTTLGEFIWSTSHLTTVLGSSLVEGFIFDREGAPSDPFFIGTTSLMKHARNTVNSYLGRLDHHIRIGVAFTESQLGCPHSVAHLEHVDTLVVKIDFEPEVKFPLSYQMFKEYMDGVVNRTQEFVESGKELNITKIENISRIYLFRLGTSSLKGNIVARALLIEKFPHYFNLLKHFIVKYEKDHSSGGVIIGGFRDERFLEEFPSQISPPFVPVMEAKELPVAKISQNGVHLSDFAVVTYEFWNQLVEQSNSSSTFKNNSSPNILILLSTDDKRNSSNLFEEVKQIRRQLSTDIISFNSTLIFASEDTRAPEFKKLTRILSATRKHKTGCLVRYSNLTGSNLEWVKVKIRSEMECKPILKFSTTIIWQFYIDFGKMTPFDYSFQWYSHFPKSGYQFHHYRPNLYSGMAKHNLFQVLLARNAFLKENPGKDVFLRLVDLKVASECRNSTSNDSCSGKANNARKEDVNSLFKTWASIHNLHVVIG